MQKFLTLIITIAILYMIVKTQFTQNTQDTPQQPQNQTAITQQNEQTFTLQQPVNFEGNFLEQGISKVLTNVLKTEEGRLFFENIIQPLNKPIAGNEGFKINNADMIQNMFKINTFGDGNVGPASCGHIVTISYQIFDVSNNLLTESTKTFALGSQEVINGLDSVVVGMMIGQTRNAILPAKYSASRKQSQEEQLMQETRKVSVTLKEILPHNFIAMNRVKIFDDEIAYRVPLMCGDIAKFNAKITKLSNGKVIYNSTDNKTKLHIKIGDMNYPMIFSHALYGKIPIGSRTVIAQGKYYKSLATGSTMLFSNMSLASDEYFMLELSDFEE